ncbi:MAG TPA: hypothetical protein VIU15_00845 [Streptomyces sp.]
MNPRRVLTGTLLCCAALVLSAAPATARAGRPVTASASPSTQDVVRGGTFTATYTLTNPTADTALEPKIDFANKGTPYKGWIASYTCPAGWTDTDSGSGSSPTAGCSSADDWTPGSRTTFTVTWKVPTDAAVGSTDVFPGTISYVEQDASGNIGGDVSYTDRYIVNVLLNEIPLVDLRVLAVFLLMLGAGAAVVHRRGGGWAMVLKN